MAEAEVLKPSVTLPEGSLLERVEALRAVIEEGGEEAQKIRRVPDETISKLVDYGFFRFAIPELSLIHI